MEKVSYVNDKLSLLLKAFTFDVQEGDVIFHNEIGITKVLYNYTWNGQSKLSTLNITTNVVPFQCRYKSITTIITNVEYLHDMKVLTDVTTQYERDKKLEELI